MILIVYLLYALVAAWLAATAFAQINRFAPYVSKYDVFNIVPRWTFFAPNPGVRDYHLVVRDRFADGSFGPWRCVPIAKPRPRMDYLWNPEKRAKKILCDNVQALKILVRDHKLSSDDLPFTLPYILLLQCSAVHVQPGEGAKERQFAVVESSGHDDRVLEAAFVSGFHLVN